MRRILSVTKKEFIEIMHDPRSLIMVLALPTVMLFIYGYAINLDLRLIKTVIYDLDKSSRSRDLIGKFENSGYFNIVGYVDKYDEVDKYLDSAKARVAICIPPDFARKLAKNETAQLQTIVDGSDASTSTVAINYINLIIQQYSLNIAMSTISSQGINVSNGLPTINIESRVWYNPELKSVNFIVPGMTAMIIMMLGSILTTLSVVSEKENGTFEKLIITPIKSYELVIGKILPFAILSFADVIFCLIVGRFWFKVPMRGSIALLLSLSSMFLFSTVGLGLLISTIAKTQRVAMMVAMLASMMPTFLLSGFVFPIESMPRFVQLVTYLIPARYYLVIMRGILLKGAGFDALLTNSLSLLAFSLIMILVSALKFRKTLA